MLPAKKLQPVTLKLNWKTDTQFLGFYVASFRGFYMDEGLEVNILPRTASDNAIPDQVANGEFDFGIGGTIQQVQSNGAPAIVIASIFQHSPEVLFAKQETGILTPADLKDHSVVIKSPGWESLIKQLLSRYNMGMQDITPIAGSFEITPFYNGDVDVWAGYLSNEVIRARIDGYEITTIPLYEYGISSNPVVIYTSQEKARNDPELVSRFLRATMRGWEWAIKNQEEAISEMIILFPELEPERKFLLASFQASIPLILPQGSVLGQIDCANWLLQMPQANNSTLCTTDFIDNIFK